MDDVLMAKYAAWADIEQEWGLSGHTKGDMSVQSFDESSPLEFDFILAGEVGIPVAGFFKEKDAALFRAATSRTTGYVALLEEVRKAYSRGRSDERDCINDEVAAAYFDGKQEARREQIEAESGDRG